MAFYRQGAREANSAAQARNTAGHQITKGRYVNPIELKLFTSRLQAICDEMGGVLQRSAFSPNIKDRLDFSCAVFAANGELASQAAHIPVHLGSMAYTMQALVASQDWQPGDMLVINNPYLGGTHLPDVTLLAPVFMGRSTTRPRLVGFVANRAHHAHIGCETPGSMPLSATINDEGVLIAPTLLLRGGELQSCGESIDALLYEQPGVLSGDFAAQVGANLLAVDRLRALVAAYGAVRYSAALDALNAYARRLSAAALGQLADGEYGAEDFLDDDGFGGEQLPLRVKIQIKGARIQFDFTQSADQVRGNLNCPESVAAAAAYYCHCCLLPEDVPLCAGLFADLTVITRKSSVLNPEYPAAVAAGNVETSMRLVDVIFRALAPAVPTRIPAASQGTMNNVAMGAMRELGSRWDYYETLAGGAGGGPRRSGCSAVHTHMTNTLNTPVESLEYHYPLRMRRVAIRRGSGGRGLNRGGEGLIREYEFLEEAQLSLLTERRRFAPWGLCGGGEGEVGQNWLNGEKIPAKAELAVSPGDRLTIETPGGGGWGQD